MDETTTVEDTVLDETIAGTDDEFFDDGVDEELLVEEVSIDGMCGVY